MGPAVGPAVGPAACPAQAALPARPSSCGVAADNHMMLRTTPTPLLHPRRCPPEHARGRRALQAPAGRAGGAPRHQLRLLRGAFRAAHHPVGRLHAPWAGPGGARVRGGSGHGAGGPRGVAWCGVRLSSGWWLGGRSRGAWHCEVLWQRHQTAACPLHQPQVCRLLEDCQEEFNLVNKSPLALGERGAGLT